MAASKVFQFFLLVSFVIFSTHALGVYLTEDMRIWQFNLQTEIKVGVHRNGSKYYNGCAEKKIFVARPETTKVVVYIRTEAKVKTDKYGQLRDLENLWRECIGYHYQLLYLIVYNFTVGDGEERVISEFLDQTIKPDQSQNNFHVYTIGEGDMNLNYTTLLGDLATYKEDKNVFGGKMYEAIRALFT